MASYLASLPRISHTLALYKPFILRYVHVEVAERRIFSNGGYLL